VPHHLRDSRFGARDQQSKADPQFDPAAQLFGGQGYAGHVRFEDVTCDNTDAWPILLLKERWAPNVQREDSRKIYLHQSAYEEGNEVLEVCPSGVRWKFTIPFHNLTQAQVGLLLVALGQEPGKPLYPKVGGGKGQGLGSVCVEQVEVWLSPAPEVAFLQYEAADTLETELSPYFQAAHTLIHQKSHARLLSLIGTLPG
jgi:hypothetical protein